jgi:hypothetical protein
LNAAAQSPLARLRRVAADAFTLFLLPVSVVLLPWSLGFRVLKCFARCERLYHEAVEPAWIAARVHCPGSDEKMWKYRFRLLRLVDQADSYLTLLRGGRWWQRRIDEHGEWPTAVGARVFLTYHWGAGHWIWQRLHAQGFDAWFLARRVHGRALGMSRLSHTYGRFRAWAICRIGSRGPLFVGGSRDLLRQALDAGDSLVGMLDLPAGAQQNAIETTLLDGHVRFPLGLASLAVESGVPVTLFSAGLDLANGRRQLWMETLPAGMNVDEIMRRYVAHLDERLRAMPEFWQIWREASLMFVDADTSSARQAL